MKRKRTASRIALLLALLLSAAAPRLSPAGPPPAPGVASPPATGEGFRSLRWDATPAEATLRYPDLAFVRYALPAGEEVPFRIYVREREDRELAGVPFDRIEYWFREDRFRKAVAEMRGQVGPRTIDSQATAAFRRATDALAACYGKPVEERVSGAAGAGRVAGWSARGVRITLSRSTEGDVETLLLEFSR